LRAWPFRAGRAAETHENDAAVHYDALNASLLAVTFFEASSTEALCSSGVDFVSSFTKRFCPWRKKGRGNKQFQHARSIGYQCCLQKEVRAFCAAVPTRNGSVTFIPLWSLRCPNTGNCAAPKHLLYIAITHCNVSMSESSKGWMLLGARCSQIVWPTDSASACPCRAVEARRPKRTKPTQKTLIVLS
jgi:hypothetical protein